MGFKKCLPGLVMLALLELSAPRGDAATSEWPTQIGGRLPELKVRGTTYHALVLKQVTVDRVTFSHPGGFVSVAWSDLPGECRELWMPLAEKPRPVLSPTAPTVRKGETSTAGKREEPTSAAATVELKTVVDFRPEIRELGLWVKDQGSRPSCAVYALLSALEYQAAQLEGVARRFDEAPILKEVERATGRAAPPGALGEDAGYNLVEVIQAVRAIGLVPLSESGGSSSEVSDAALPYEIQFGIIPASSSHREILLMVEALNRGYPLPIALAWPYPAATHGGLIDSQSPQPNYRHAVTLVGYECPTGRIEDTVFLFKNSWGVRWGSSGFGRVSYRYLTANLFHAVIVHLEKKTPPS